MKKLLAGELLNESSVDTMDAPLFAAFLDIAAIHQERISRFALPVHRHLSGVSVPGDRAIVDRCIRGHRDDACLQAHQVDIAATIQRHAGHLFVADDVAQLCIAGIDLRGIGIDRHRLLDGANFRAKSARYFWLTSSLMPVCAFF